MTITLGLLILVVIIALVFDLVNGFHDAANSIATIVSTRVLSPFTAVIWAGFFNFIAILFFAPRVADTISKIVKIVPHDINYIYVVLFGLLGAIIWDLITWRIGLPTSSSHALIGGLTGAGVAYAGSDVIQWEMLREIVAFIVLAPLIGFALGLSFMFLLYWFCQDRSPANVQNFCRKGQLLSAALYSIGHGANDAQKTMGIIVAVLIAAGHLHPGTEISLVDPQTLWIILSCQLAMGIGTAMGGWRIVKTMGMKIVKLKPTGGFCAELAGASTLFFATHFGIPVSTTHTITGAIVGVGTVSMRFSRIKWGIAANVIWAWIFTIPAAFLLSAGMFWIYNWL